MNDISKTRITRRDLLKNTGKAAAVATVGSLAMPQNVWAGEDNTIQLALIGCGGRGTGAADNALSVDNGPIKLVAMCDVFPNKLNISHKTLADKHKDIVDVPDDRKFIGFDGFKQAMDCLKPGDIVILTTPVAFRWVHFDYAIQKGLNVFMEKPVSVDGPSSRKMFELGEESVKKNLKVGVGLMCRHCVVRQEQFDRIQNGEIGELTMLRAYRMAGPTATAFSEPKPEGISELMYQIQRFHSFLWASGGAFSDFLIHNIDECCWMKDAWPVEARGSGGRHYRGNYIDQNFDNYTTEYTFADGTKLWLEGRTMSGCETQFASFAHGTKGSAIISRAGHTPARSRLHSDHTFSSKSLIWDWKEREPNPYQLEWDDLIAAIRDDKPYNEVKRGVEASLVTAMGRMACHTGRVITYDEMLNHDQDLTHGVDQLVIDGPAPIQADGEGKYPVPQPGIITSREY